MTPLYRQGNVLEQRALSVARQLLGEDMALDYDQLLQKQRSGRTGAPNGAVFAWHQDQAYWQVACACPSIHRHCCPKLTPRRGAM